LVPTAPASTVHHVPTLDPDRDHPYPAGPTFGDTLSSSPRLSGALNFRDVGGVPVGADRRVRSGQLFRSDTLQFLTEEDMVALVEVIGLRTDVDLRLAYEVDLEGRGPLAQTNITLHHLPFQVPAAQQAGSAAPILQESDPIVTHYCDYLHSSPDSVAGVVKVLAQPGALPAIVHCAAGKDRTGIAVAMTLAAVGCTSEDIATEYAAGSHAIPGVMERLRTMQSYGDSISGLPPEASLTPPEYILRFFEIVTARYGSPRDYLRRYGVTDEELAALVEGLTEPVPAPGVRP